MSATATGWGSNANGLFATATGGDSTATGATSLANGADATAIGEGNVAAQGMMERLFLLTDVDLQPLRQNAQEDPGRRQRVLEAIVRKLLLQLWQPDVQETHGTLEWHQIFGRLHGP